MNEQVEAVQRMQDYIGTHLSENITLADLSRASCYSPWHSHRLFYRYIGVSPADYIRRLRLSRSVLRLRDERVKIIDVALGTGFQSVDGYQRAFYREFGCNPGEFAKSPVPIYLFIPYSVKYSHIEREITVSETKTIFVHVTEKPARKVLIKRGIKAKYYWDYCEEVGCDIFGLLTSIPSIGGEPVSMWLPDHLIKPGTSEYVQGAEVALDYTGVVPDGLEVIELPATKYLMFQGEPFPEEQFCEAINEVWAAIEKYNPAILGYEWDKSNPRIQLEPRGERGYIELVAVK